MAPDIEAATALVEEGAVSGGTPAAG